MKALCKYNPSMKQSHKKQLYHFNQGFTVIELMIALVLGLIIIGGVLTVFLSNSQTFRTNEALSRIQENGRFAIDLLGTDLRHAAYLTAIEVCAGQVPFTKQLDLTEEPRNLEFRFPQEWSDTRVDLILQHFTRRDLTSSNENLSFIELSSKPNSLTINGTLDQSGINSLAISTSGSSSINLVEGQKIKPLIDALIELNDNGTNSNIAILALEKDCNYGSAVEVTNASDVIQSFTDVESTTENELELTLQVQVGEDHDLGGNNLFDNGKLIILNQNNQIGEFSFFIEDDAITSEPTLFRQRGNSSPEPLVPGAESLTVTYGVKDSSGDIDYKQQQNLNANDLQNIRSIRIELVLISAEDNITDQNDGRLRQSFSTTVALRNLL